MTHVSCISKVSYALYALHYNNLAGNFCLHHSAQSERSVDFLLTSYHVAHFKESLLCVLITMKTRIKETHIWPPSLQFSAEYYIQPFADSHRL